jgi:hypothetical protein
MMERHNPTSACTGDSINKDRLLTWGKDPERQAEDELFYLRARDLRGRELEAEKRLLSRDENYKHRNDDINTHNNNVGYRHNSGGGSGLDVNRGEINEVRREANHFEDGNSQSSRRRRRRDRR